MARTAAIFDLDRTILADSSGLLISEAMVDVGLLSERDQRLAQLGRRFFRVVGETWIGMQITRRSISRIAGWSQADLREAARRSADVLYDNVWSEALALIERHRDEGHLVAIATSTGADIVQPLADRLKVDELIATEYEVGDEGVLTGGFIGKWLWGPDKADAVRAFAAREEVDLAESFAYSDSFYDRHLLEIVGHPRAVNPDALLRAYALTKGWPVLQFRNDPEGPSVGADLYDMLLPIAHPLLSPVNVHVEGLERVPSRGPVILAANHRSYLDPLVLSMVAARRGRKLRYLGKKEVFDAPVLGQFARASGQIRVDRGTGQSHPLREAEDALARGEAIGIFPQGTIPRGARFYEPKLEGRTGTARLAAAAGAPVVPVAIWGTEAIWPRNSRLPRVQDLLVRRGVHARVGEPMHLRPPRGQEEDKEILARLTERLMDGIADLLPDDVRNAPPPSEDQIQAATPPDVSER